MLNYCFQNYDIENPVTSDKSKRDAVRRWEKIQLTIKINNEKTSIVNFYFFNTYDDYIKN